MFYTYFDEKPSRYFTRIGIAGDSYNPLEVDEGEYSEILQRIVANQRLTFNWSYKNGVNFLSYTFKKQRNISLFKQLILSIVLAFVVSLICSLFPAQGRNFLCDNIIAPLSIQYFDRTYFR